MVAEIVPREMAQLGEGDETLASVVIGLLKSAGLTIALAESCTGGLVTSALVEVPGCSAVLREGLVTYANESKIARLGVSEGLINRHGAVSAQTAAAMAENVARTSGADVGLSVTGIAGPDGGSEEKPVGLVYIGLHIYGKTQVARYQLNGTRNEIRIRAAKTALDMLRREL